MDRCYNESMSEAVRIRLHRARSWLRKAGEAASKNDDDAEFIFLWIALNALYGLPRYRDDIGVKDAPEIDDLKQFLKAIEDLSGGSVKAALEPLSHDIQKIMENPFLSRANWKIWDRRGIRERRQRLNIARNVSPQSLCVAELFERIYTLRNQLLHGAATDSSRRNRESIRHAVPILRKAVAAAIEHVERYQSQIPQIDLLPYPPSIGQGGWSNRPRFHR